MKKLNNILFPILSAALISLSVRAVPIAENQEIETLRGVCVSGQLCAATPDGGSVTYTLTTAPSKGSVELTEDGHYVYTPEAGRRGRDYFGYRAQDRCGELSGEAVVIVRLKPNRQKTLFDLFE